MEEKPVVSSPQINRWAYVTPLLGLSSFVPYVVIWVFPPVGFLIGLYCLAWGLIVGMTSVIGGVVEIKQITNNPQKEIELRMAILSIVLGIIGIVVNILYIYLVMFVMQFD